MADSMYVERVLRARRMKPEDKLSAGIKLFEYACEITRLGIRRQFPDADAKRVQQILLERLALRRRLEEGLLFDAAKISLEQ